VIIIPNLSVLELDPGSQPPGITSKLIIDATTPVSPDDRGHYSQQVHDLPEMPGWLAKLQALAAGR
jgi:3-polyprenyl-4-hydroxybenzoate decarboxylase